MSADTSSTAASAPSRPLMVCVTGASGFLAGHVLQQLNEQKGRWVAKGTVRSLKNTTKTAHLLPLGATLVEADLLKPATLVQAFSGCDVVFHVASPFIRGAPNPHEQVIRPALDGTKNVMAAALEAKVGRVVVTSSVAAIHGSQRDNDPNHLWCEEDWNDVVDAKTAPYTYSKTVAEKAAWAFAKAHPEMEVAVVNPNFILGPPLGMHPESQSVNMVLHIIDGTFAADGIPARSWGVCDVRDVAETLIKAAVAPEAVNERFIVSSRAEYTLWQVIQLVARLFPDHGFPLPTRQIEPVATDNPNNADASKVKRVLGMQLRTLEVTIKDMVDQLVAQGRVPTAASS